MSSQHLSMPAHHALIALLYLARAGGDTVTTTEEIADYYGVSMGSVGLALRTLVRLGYVRSVRGKLGGFLLVADPAKTTVSEIIGAIEGDISRERCLLSCGTFCNFSPAACPLGTLWNKIQKAVLEELSLITLKEMAHRYPDRAPAQIAHDSEPVAS